jgi:acetoin utilization deacetylase AcuC-like enzyme
MSEFQLPVVYSPEYDLRLGQHVFPSDKFRRVYDLLRQGPDRHKFRFLEPVPATDDDLLLVHRADYVARLLRCEPTPQELIWLEIPWSEATLRGFLYAVGGSILAGRTAISDGAAFNLTGGFHHAFADHGEGFCALHDVAIAIRRMQREKLATQFLIVDCDVHQGNGTAAIFAGDADVFTLSLHQERNYPVPKPPSDLDVNLEDGAGDDEYLQALADALRQAFARFRPEMLWYIAGADPYRDDQLGGLALTMEGLRGRDEMVFAAAGEYGIPFAAALAGGYARSVDDTVQIHAATVLAAQSALAGRH